MDTREVGQLTTAQVPDQCLRSSGEGVGLSKRIWAPWSVQDSRASWAEELAPVTKMAAEGGEQTEKCDEKTLRKPRFKGELEHVRSPASRLHVSP